MTTYPILFSQTPETLRRIGARGGRAHGRNWRLRQRTTPPVELPLPPSELPAETTAQAIATLDAKFPWLCRAERRTPQR